MARNGDEQVPGYALLGKLMWEHSDTAIFRSFGAFSAENLLYLQAELVGLENELRYAQKADQGSPHPERQRYAVNWVGLSQSAGEDACERDDGTQWQIVLEMRSKLKEYRSCNPISLASQDVSCLGAYQSLIIRRGFASSPRHSEACQAGKIISPVSAGMDEENLNG
jgi:hypothetical protein